MVHRRLPGRTNAASSPRLRVRAETASRGARPVVILGAGADVPFKLPTIPRLAQALDEFCRTDGKPVDEALRKKIPYVHLRFGKIGAEAGERLVVRLFQHPKDISPLLDSIQLKLAKIASAAAVAQILKALGEMATRNEVSADLVETLPGSEKGAAQGASSSVLDPERLVLTPEVRNAIRITFQNDLPKTDLTPDESKLADEILAEVSNVEDLLSLHFARFSERGGLAEKRTFLYLAWILWSFLRIRSSEADRTQKSIYDSLAGLDAEIVTFNYTNFFPASALSRVRYFHGELARFIEIDSRQVVSGDSDLTAAKDARSVVAFLDKRRLDVTLDGYALDLPDIVPPLTFKPIMSREQLRTWAEVDSVMERASAVAIVGYSFAQVDEHFNDLLRKGASSAPIVVVTRRPHVAWRNAARVLNITKAPKMKRFGGRDALKAGRLTCVAAEAEGLDQQDLLRMLRH